MNHKSVIITDRDTRLLEFLWQWKVATTATLSHLFFWDARKGTAAYKRLNLLHRAGYILLKLDEPGKRYYWTLTKKGFRAVRERLPALREEGYAPEHVRHDSLVTAMHIGDWIFGAPAGVQTFSEQQLRRIAIESYPVWVPSGEEHRPDGYWGLPRAGRIVPVAVEVELNIKSSSDYGRIADFYDDHKQIERVLWLVTSRSAAAKIHCELRESTSEKCDIHNFALVSEFEKKCWDAEIVLGPDRKRTLLSFLSALCETAVPTSFQSRSRGNGHPPSHLHHKANQNDGFASTRLRVKTQLPHAFKHFGTA